MYMKIYQPRPGEKRFLSLEEAGGTADPAKYEQVFCGDLDAQTPEEVVPAVQPEVPPAVPGSLPLGGRRGNNGGRPELLLPAY